MWLSHCLSRRNIYAAGLGWGFLVIALAVVKGAPFAAGILQGVTRPDGLYHYHLSVVVAGVFGALLFGVMGIVNGSSLAHGSLRGAFTTLALLDLLAVAGGGLLTYVIGWVKELVDALNGKFMDAADLSADWTGVMSFAAFALCMMVPVHAVAAIFSGPVRRRLLSALVPAAAHPHLRKVCGLEERLQGNAGELNAHERDLDRIDRKLMLLERHFRVLPVSARSGEQGRNLREMIRRHEQDAERVHGRIVELEQENRRLRRELGSLRSVPFTESGAAAVTAEVESLTRMSIAQETRIHAAKARHDFIAERAALVLRNAGSVPAGEPVAAGEAGSVADAERVMRLETFVHALRRRVLVVDPDGECCDRFRRALERTGLLRVTTAKSAYDAIREMRECDSPPDLILVEALMPGVSGGEFLAALEQRRGFDGMPVIVCASEDEAMIPALRRVSYAAFLRKPVQDGELVAAVLGALRIPIGAGQE